MRWEVLTKKDRKFLGETDEEFIENKIRSNKPNMSSDLALINCLVGHRFGILSAQDCESEDFLRSHSYSLARDLHKRINTNWNLHEEMRKSVETENFHDLSYIIEFLVNEGFNFYRHYEDGLSIFSVIKGKWPEKIAIHYRRMIKDAVEHREIGRNLMNFNYVTVNMDDEPWELTE
jgi:hypothetical protein